MLWRDYYRDFCLYHPSISGKWENPETVTNNVERKCRFNTGFRLSGRLFVSLYGLPILLGWTISLRMARLKAIFQQDVSETSSVSDQSEAEFVFHD